jgi:hypothetical protein
MIIHKCSDSRDTAFRDDRIILTIIALRPSGVFEEIIGVEMAPIVPEYPVPASLPS